MIRKFYNDGATEGTGGADTTQESTASSDFSVGGTFDLSSLQNDGDEDEGEAEAESDKGADSGSEGSKPAEQSSATQESSAPPAGDKAGENPKPAEPAAGEEPKDTGEEVKPPSLEEVLKGQDRKEVLKALGISEEVYDALESATSLEELRNFLDQRTKNWDDVPHEELLRESLKREYSDLDADKFERVFRAELKKYSLDSFDEEERELGEIRLQREAEKLRKQFKAEQSEFRLPEKAPSPEAQELKELRSAQEQAKAEYEEFAKGIAQDAVTKRLLQDKRLTLADGYQFETDPQQLVDAVVDTSKMFAACVKEDGSFDLERAFKIANYALNLDSVHAALMDHARSKVNQETMNEYINPSQRDNPTSAEEAESLGKAFATRGVATNLGSIFGV